MELTWQKIKTYKQWVTLSEQKQKEEYDSWNAYEGEGQNILIEVSKHFKEKYKKQKDVVEISQGLYHGGMWIIDVSVKKGASSIIPKTFQGIPIMKFYK